MNPSGHYTVLHSFKNRPDGSDPTAGVIADSAGNLYGTTFGGGLGFGVVYKLDSAGHETVLYTFTGGYDGGYPEAGLIRDSDGNLYGTTSGGGIPSSSTGRCGIVGCGVVFKVDLSGQEKVYYSFTGEADGAAPQSRCNSRLGG